MENIYNLVLDLKQKITQTEIVIPQLDNNTHKFNMKVTQNGDEYVVEDEIESELAILKSDGHFVVLPAQKMGSTYTATLTEQALTTAGITKAELRFKKNNELLTSTQFNFLVREVIVSNKNIESTTVYKALEALVAKSEEITQKLDAAIKTFDNVEAIKQQLEEINTKILQAKEALEQNIETANLKSEDIKKIITQADTALQSFDSRKPEIENLKVLVKNASDLNFSLQNLLTQIQKAEEINQTLKTQTENSTSLKNDLVTAAQTGENLKQVLSDEVTKATQIEPTLKATNQQAESLKTTLVENNQKAENLNKSLKSNTTKAEGLNTNLQQLISDGNLTKESLVPIVEDGKVKISTLQDLLSRVGKTKSEVEEIIAQGNLDKYITTVSLDNKLQAYATKDDLSKIDVTAQLVDYAKKTEIPTKLSQLTNDKTFKTETEIIQLINSAKKLKKEVVSSLPSTGQEDIIYLLKNKGDANNFYTEYLWINGSWEIIGDTKVDLSEYLKTRDLKSSKLRTNKNNINAFTDRSTSEHQLDIILGDLELRTEENKKNIKTKLSELNDDENHRTVTDEEKQKLNNVKLSRSATFIIANYDSSENSKAGADYVIQENECAAEIINSFVAKLPEYGGKILLTEGNFNSKKNLAINFNKSNTIIEGYGDSTTIIDKLTKDERKSVIISISDGIENCKLLNLNITHEASNSIYIRGNNNTIQNIKIKNNGTFPSLCINKNINKNILNNISVESTSYCYWIMENSNNNKLSNCTGVSTSNNVFHLQGNKNNLLFCTGTSAIRTFYVDGSNNQLLSCTGTSADDTFYVHGSNNQLSNCTGTSTNAVGIRVYESNNQLLSCTGTSANKEGIYVDGSKHNVSNCTGTSTNGKGIYVHGSNNQLSNCTGTSTNAVGIYIEYSSGLNVIMGNRYSGNGITNNGYSSNIIANNVKMEV